MRRDWSMLLLAGVLHSACSKPVELPGVAPASIYPPPPSPPPFSPGNDGWHERAIDRDAWLASRMRGIDYFLKHLEGASIVIK